MNVSREVVTDLLPVYFSGQASADTVTLVEEFFEGDPEFEKLARSDVDRLLETLEPDNGMEGIEMKALERTKRLLRMRSTLTGFGIFFTILPFSFHVSDGGQFQWILLENTVAVSTCLVMAFICWIGYLIVRYRTRTSEL